jgi:DNA-binding NtrC family response regulator
MHAGPVLEADYLPREIGRPERSEDISSLPGFAAAGLGLDEAIERFERGIIRDALSRTGGNVLQAAQNLRVPRGTLRYKMAKYGL